MAVYKVPQDVEAEDKLIGPFSFRQFIYLIVAALGIFLAWALSRVFIGLLVIPLPIVLAMLALALPLRKDQPMETYLIAMIKFFFKPRKRIWDPEGTIDLVQITAPKVAEGPQLKEFGGDEASQRLAYLSQIVDTQGWASRGVANSSLSDIFVADASKAEDILDESSSLAQSLDQRLTQADDSRLESVRERFQASIQQTATAPASPPTTQATYTEEQIAAIPYSPMNIDQFAYAPVPTAQPVQTGSAPQNATMPSYTPENIDPSIGTAAPIQPTNDPAPTQQQPQDHNQYTDIPAQMPLSDPQTPTYNPYPSSMRQKVLSPTGTPPSATPQSPPASPTQSTSSKPVSPDIIRLANNNDLSISALAREAERVKKDDDNEVVIKLH